MLTKNIYRKAVTESISLHYEQYKDLVQRMYESDDLTPYLSEELQLRLMTRYPELDIEHASTIAFVIYQFYQLP